MTGVICGTGSYIPVHTMDNNDIAQLVETNDEWIRERTGVVKRHIIQEETTVSMAADAARKALENGNVSAEEVDLILVSTISSNVILPCAACEVQKAIGAVNATCFDLSAACTGFVFAYNTAVAYLASGMYRTVLIIGSESLSNLTNWKDRGTCILFGDGAGAAVVKAAEGKLYRAVTHSDGFKGEALTCTSRHNRNWEEIPLEETYMQMDGQAVFKFAVKRVPEAVKEVLEKNNMTAEEIDYFILHQANKRIVEAVAKRLDVSIDKFPMNLQEYGNTSSASIPILLDEMSRGGRLKKGQKIILAGFGAGLSWGATILEWNK
ncbi:3-oxoacyl-[acyl-carrier-protein] synthase 3 [Claveliimonas bilis]|uniref:beta-ketoacyl-ACP synthase III n=1 Tax=Claveliimonas bilis TaxID=3028070 RepID=UPI001E4F09CE|nr:beta-ketoacyl-ACP synthase III [Claveliimonas bilis]BCZ27664.1 3-oxoacyl-[acyl-carrier-protein] synthase 3 [Claveliimonas bilis]BDZ83646.1 3-oxoacyl-[acyl-carrier-protein] synthase 3 [Claveliimonas bilis]